MRYLIIATGVILVMISISTTCVAWNRGERELLNLAYQEGKKIGEPELLQIFLVNETAVGRWGRYGDDHFEDWKLHCFGVMQIQFHTARLFVDKFTDYELTDIELVRRLRFDDAFCIELAGVYVKWLLKFNKGDIYKTILSYNVGPGNVRKYGLEHDPNGYLDKAISNLKRFIIPFNTKYGNGTVVKYKIQPGDTYHKIASKILVDGNRWREIQALNPEVKPTELAIGSYIYIKR
jgi:hypothetical protein